MRIPLKIETHDRKIRFDIASVGDSLSSGTGVDAPGGAKVEYQSTYVRRALGIPEILEFIVEASVTIDLGLFAAWLYEKVRDKPVEKIVIRRREITEITEGNIRKALEEEITINEH